MKGKKKQLNVTIDEYYLEGLDFYSEFFGMSKSNIIQQALVAWLEKQNKWLFAKIHQELEEKKKKNA